MTETINSNPTNMLKQQSSLQSYLSVHTFDDEKVKLDWKNLNYNILVKDAKKSTFMKPYYNNKSILNNVSGSAESGQLLAIMGPTGCGKTSLLNCLAGRVSSAGSASMKLSGEILVNGKRRKDANFRKHSAYVLQDDKLYAQLTVYETMMLSAEFYLPVNVSKDAKHQLVMAVVTELGLIKAKDTQIGDEKTRGVSGGERKRVNIACQLISNPRVLFLDEPTSGLDSFQALSVMESMKAMAMNGRLIISVIHQPRSSIYDMFDKLLLLSAGKVMYSGDASVASQWFKNCGFPCPRLFNPSDHFLDILSLDNRTPELEKVSTEQVELLGKLWYEEVKNKKILSSSSIDQQDSNDLLPTASTHGNVHPKISIEDKIHRFLKNLKLLSWRSWSSQMRDKGTIFAKIFLTTFFACLTAGMYNHAGNDTAGIYNRLGLIFIVAINQTFNAVLGVLNTFPKEKDIVNRERNANAYDTVSYFFAKFITEMPLNVIPPIIFSSIIYFIVGLQEGVFGYFLLITMLLAVTAIALGLGISAAVPSIEAANALGPPFVIIALLFGGFYINLNSLPIVANWIPYMSLIRWGFEALCINEFTGLTFSCTPGNPANCVITGESVLEGLGFGGHPTSYAVFGLGMVLLGFLSVALLLLYLSKGTFLNMGHVGSRQRAYVSPVADKTKVEVTVSKETPVEAVSANNDTTSSAAAVHVR